MIRRRPGAFTAALGSPAGGDANRVSSSIGSGGPRDLPGGR